MPSRVTWEAAVLAMSGVWPHILLKRFVGDRLLELPFSLLFVQLQLN